MFPNVNAPEQPSGITINMDKIKRDIENSFLYRQESNIVKSIKTNIQSGPIDVTIGDTRAPIRIEKKQDGMIYFRFDIYSDYTDMISHNHYLEVFLKDNITIAKYDDVTTFEIKCVDVNEYELHLMKPLLFLAIHDKHGNISNEIRDNINGVVTMYIVDMYIFIKNREQIAQGRKQKPTITPSSLTSHNIKQLYTKAQRMSISGRSTMCKGELIKAIVKHANKKTSSKPKKI